MEVCGEIGMRGILPVGLTNQVGKLVGVLADSRDTDRSCPVVVVEGLEVGKLKKILLVDNLLRFI